jgi:Domain of unknown function (DUF4870)
MTSEPPRPAERRPRADLWQYWPEAGDRRAWTRGARHPRRPGAGVPEAEVTLATFGYLGAVFLGPVIPLGIYLVARRISPFTRDHVVMALNLSLTWLLYAVCCLIFGGVLLLDSLTTALAVTLPIAFALWLSMVRYLIRGIGAANRGELTEVPAWICARIAR